MDAWTPSLFAESRLLVSQVPIETAAYVARLESTIETALDVVFNTLGAWIWTI